MLKLATKFAPRRNNFELAWEAGYRHAEFWLDQRILQQVDEAVSLAHDYPFGYALHCPNQLDLTPESLQNLATLYREIDASCLVIHELQYRKYATELRRLAPEIVLASENHEFSLDEFAQWEREFETLTFDIEHLWLFTLNSGPLSELIEHVRRFFDRSFSRLRHVHLPGYLPGSAEHRPMYCNRDFVFAMFDLLSEYGFEGLVVSEIELEFQNPHDLLMDRLLFDRWRTRRQGDGFSRDSIRR